MVYITYQVITMLHACLIVVYFSYIYYTATDGISDENFFALSTAELQAVLNNYPAVNVLDFICKYSFEKGLMQHLTVNNSIEVEHMQVDGDASLLGVSSASENVSVAVETEIESNSLNNTDAQNENASNSEQSAGEWSISSCMRYYYIFNQVSLIYRSLYDR